MWPDRVSNPGPLTYESGALPIALRGPACAKGIFFLIVFFFCEGSPLFVSPAKQKRDICTAFPVSSLSSSLSSSSAA